MFGFRPRNQTSQVKKDTEKRRAPAEMVCDFLRSQRFPLLALRALPQSPLATNLLTGRGYFA